jgi:protein-S-isoprenylcysteine O-methyltransferase Ste14
MNLRQLMGSGEKIGLLVLPFLVGGLVLNLAFPSVFKVGGPPAWLRVASIAVLIPGVVIWIWSAALILTKVPRGELITTGPYALVKHPLYTDVALLVLPWIGFLLNSWLGVVLGLVLYAGTRIFAPEEEKVLSASFGARWEAYRRRVMLPWA